MIKTHYQTSPPQTLCHVFPYGFRSAKLSLQLNLQLHSEPGQRVSSAGTMTLYSKKKEAPWKSDFSILLRTLKVGYFPCDTQSRALPSVGHPAPSRRCGSCPKIHTATILRFCYIFFIRAAQLLWRALGSQYSRGNPDWVMGSLAPCAESAAFLSLWGLLSISVLGVEAANFTEFCLG